MFFPRKRARRRECQTVRPGIEALESRAYLSVATDVTLTVPSIPQSAVAGQVANDRVSIDLANNGAARAAGRVEIQLFASTSQMLGADAIAIKNPVFGRLAIAAGRTRKLTYLVKEFPSNLQGNYFILAEVTGAIEATGSSATQVDVQAPLVDLVPKITAAPASASVGQRIEVTVSLTNDGNVVARGPLEVDFEASLSDTGTGPFELVTALTKHIKIWPGRQETRLFPVLMASGLPTGNEYLVAIVDPNHFYASFSNTDVDQTAISVT